MGIDRLHPIRPTLNQHRHHRFARLLQPGQKGQLFSGQVQTAGIHIFSAIHGCHILDLERAVVVEFPTGKAAGRAAQHGDHHIRLPGGRHSFLDLLRVRGKPGQPGQ